MRYSPHDYQTFATDFILAHPIAAVLLDMGLGKSVITLTALFDLCLDSFLIRKVLVIAPLRVAGERDRTEGGAAPAGFRIHHQPGERPVAHRGQRTPL